MPGAVIHVIQSVRKAGRKAARLSKFTEVLLKRNSKTVKPCLKLNRRKEQVKVIQKVDNLRTLAREVVVKLEMSKKNFPEKWY